MENRKFGFLYFLQEVRSFQDRGVELVSIFILDFFNSRIDAQHTDGEWSVEKVLQVIVANSWSWRGEGMKVQNWL